MLMNIKKLAMVAFVMVSVALMGFDKTSLSAAAVSTTTVSTTASKKTTANTTTVSTTASKKTTANTTTVSATASKKTTANTTTVKPERKVYVKNLKVETVSVSCLKVTWDAEEGREYTLTIKDAPYAENITFLFEGNSQCYITGLREGSRYSIVAEASLKPGEDAVKMPMSAIGYTEKVHKVYTYPYEPGWTGCFAGEKASGLRAMPSSGAIAGSSVDNITGTGIRRKPNGDYCVAMGLFYGSVGDRFLITMDNGSQFTVQICDSKGWADDADGDGILDGRFHWFGGEGNGKCIIEMIYDDANLPSNVRFSGSWGGINWNGLNLSGDIAEISMIDY